MKAATIAAVATAPGAAGIGIVRVSGDAALPIAERLFHPRRDCASPGSHTEKPWESHRLYYGTIRDPFDGSVIDEVLMAVMKAPHSYTREDVVEIQGHGGPVALRDILDRVLRCGARLAEPGEFTRRAFVNGRIDLSQAEAVIDLIQSRTTAGRKMASAQLGGEGRSDVESVRDALKAILAEVEAAIDFPDDVGELAGPAELAGRLARRVQAPLSGMQGRFEQGRILREGYRLGVIGRPNVGKSSLMNRLLDEERVIVTEVPGTTRDTVEEQIAIGGVPVVLVDTAGLQDSLDPVEKVGMQKTRQVIARADGILLVIDGSRPLTEADRAVFEQISQERTLLVVNKTDKESCPQPYPVPEAWQKMRVVEVSALYNRRIDTLKDRIAEMAVGGAAKDVESGLIPNLRQKAAIQDAYEAVCRAGQELAQEQPMELVAIWLQEGLTHLGRILGIEVREEVLDEIFSRFCIGK